VLSLKVLNFFLYYIDTKELQPIKYDIKDSPSYLIFSHFTLTGEDIVRFET